MTKPSSIADFDLQLFANEGENGGGNDGNAGANEGNQNPPQGSSGASGGEGDDLSKKSAEELAVYARQLRGREAAARTKLADAERERNELKTWREERESKELEEQKQFKTLADTEKQKRLDVERDRDEKLKAADLRYVRAEVRAAAIKAGIVDPKDVNNFDVTDLRVDENGDVVGVDAFVATQKAAKPHWFRQAESSNSNEGANGNNGTPPPARGKQSGESDRRDWSAASADDLNSELDRMMGVRF